MDTDLLFAADVAPVWRAFAAAQRESAVALAVAPELSYWCGWTPLAGL